MADPVKDMVEEVRSAGLKLTPQRMAIIRELAGDPSHPTAQELYDRLHAELPTMSFATVYNTLASLATAGLCSARALDRGPARFDPNTVPHDHAVCDGCGLVVDVPLAEAAHGNEHVAPTGEARGPLPTPAGPGSDQGFRVRVVERVYRGLCAPCQKEGTRR